MQSKEITFNNVSHVMITSKMNTNSHTHTHSSSRVKKTEQQHLDHNGIQSMIYIISFKMGFICTSPSSVSVGGVRMFAFVLV